MIVLRELNQRASREPHAWSWGAVMAVNESEKPTPTGRHWLTSRVSVGEHRADAAAPQQTN